MTIKSRPVTPEYSAGFDRIFNKAKAERMARSFRRRQAGCTCPSPACLYPHRKAK